MLKDNESFHFMKEDLNRFLPLDIFQENENFLGRRDFEATYKLVFSHAKENSLIDDKGELINDLYFLKNPSKTDNIEEPIPSLKSMNKNDKKFCFRINHVNRDSLFTELKNNFLSDKKETIFLETKRKKTRRQRRDNKDNIRKKIKRGFLNNALINKLNYKSRIIGSNLYFEKFPQFFVSDVDQKRNKKIMNMKLIDIFEKEELYMDNQNKWKSNYLHNLKVIESKEIRENVVFKNVLNKTFGELYKEYINSIEFEFEEIDRLKQKGMDENYIHNYKIIAKGLIEFFS